jgi:hypothetical protein
VPDRFATDVGRDGEVVFISEPAAELRPADAAPFVADADSMAAEAAEGLLGPTARIELRNGHMPDACPHCGGRLSYGTGAHVPDAAARGNAIAWECLDCQAAGMVFGTPL